MSSKPSGPQANGRSQRLTKNTLPDDLVARVKRDLKTMTRRQVARKHALSKSRVRSIDDGTAYPNVPAAPEQSDKAVQVRAEEQPALRPGISAPADLNTSGLNSLDLISDMLVNRFA